jgi:hypothetical protein
MTIITTTEEQQQQEIKKQKTTTISISFRKYLNHVPGKQEIRELQKKAILDTAQILQKELL